MTVYNRRNSFPRGAIYIGRGSMWGNPFKIGVDGDRDTVCEKHKEYLWQQIKSGEITLSQLAALHGADLICYCAPLRCHGHTLERAAAWAYSKLEEEAVKQ